MMKFRPELENGTLLRRYKRFLADVRVGEEIITVHCANTGAMKNCVVENSLCWIQNSHNPKRKYLYTWELATTSTGHLACVNTHRANALVEEALQHGLIKELRNYTSLEKEVRFANSRFDFCLDETRSAEGEIGKCLVEVKSVTYGLDSGVGLFPDAKSVRALKHVNEMIQVKNSGRRAVLFFCVQHEGIECVSPADDIDPDYARALREAAEGGVELLAYRARISSCEIVLSTKIPVVL